MTRRQQAAITQALCAFLFAALFSCSLCAESALDSVRVPVLYESVADLPSIGGRTPEEIARILKELRADMVFRCFFKWAPFPNSPEEQRRFLRMMDETLHSRGVHFVYPIHGGSMGQDPAITKRLSFGRYRFYDALAPEFEAYETIREMAVASHSASSDHD